MNPVTGTSSSRPHRPGRDANSVRRAFRILELLADKPDGLPLAVTCRQAGLPRSSTYVILRTLERDGYLEKRADGRYRLALRLLKFGNAVLSNLELPTTALPFLKRLVERTGCSARLAILEGGEAVAIAIEDAPGIVRVASWVGRRMPVHGSAVGKVLLAFSPPERMAEVIERGLVPCTPRTIVQPEKLRAELERVRRLGYALNDEETTMEVRAVAAPIFDSRGAAVASVCIAGTTRQIKTAVVPKLASIVQETARKISRELGYDA
jgi:DNA-binding IclR family transcriptional regulator